MKINFVLPSYSVRPIGGFKVAYEYANQLVARGHEVTIIHPRSMRDVTRSSAPKDRLFTAAVNARNVFTPRAGLKWQPLDQRVRVAIVPEAAPRHVPDADAVFATAWQTAEYVCDYAPSKGAKFYLVMDFDPWIAPRQVLERTWAMPMLKVTISSWLYDKVRAAGCPDSEIVNLPIGINFEHFQMRSDVRARGDKILMMFSNAPSKGSEIGLQAINQVKETHPHLELSLFGPTNRRRPEGLPPWANYFGVASNRRLQGLYNQSKIYVCSSFAEGFALPPAEAMACGCAVVATDCGGIQEFARHGENALLSPPGDVDALARNIRRLLDDDELRIKLAERGRQAIKSFSWETAASTLEQVMVRYTGSYATVG